MIVNANMDNQWRDTLKVIDILRLSFILQVSKSLKISFGKTFIISDTQKELVLNITKKISANIEIFGLFYAS